MSYLAKVRAKQTYTAKEILFLIICLLGIFLIRNGMVLNEMFATRAGGSLPEALISGNLAFDLLNDTWRGWESYLYIRRAHLGNEIIVSLIVLPLYYFFGHSLFILTQAPIIFSLVMLLVLYSYCKKFFSKNVAIIACIFMVCSSLDIQGWWLYPFMIHVEPFFWHMLAVLFFTKAFEENQQANIKWISLTGLVAGIAIFHSDIFLLTFGLISVIWFKKDNLLFLKKEFRVFIFSLILGLLPVIYFEFLGFGSLGTIIKSLFTGSLTGWKVGGASVPGSLAVASDIFWPLKNLLFGKINGISLSFLGLSIFALMFSLRLKSKRYNDAVIILYVYFFILVFTLIIFNRTMINYYFFVALLPAYILTADALCFLLQKCTKRIHKYLFWGLIVSLSLVNTFEIASHMNFSRSSELFQKQLNRNGCGFFCPGDYRFYNGYYTKVGLEVRKEYSKNYTKRALPHHLIPYGNFVNIFLENKYAPVFIFPLKERTDYLFYGMTVSYLGLEVVAHRVEREVPEKFKDAVYKGLAFFYSTDNWFKDILEKYKNGTIQHLIPREFQIYFYEELGRKLFQRYNGQLEELQRQVDSFNAEEKKWIQNTILQNYENKKEEFKLGELLLPH